MKKIIRLFLLLLILFPILATTSASADDKTAFADAIKAIGKKGDDAKPDNAGDAWSYLGPESQFFGISTKTTSESNYENISDSDIKHAEDAANFGYMLYATGLDHSIQGNNWIIGGMNICRSIFGNIILLAYMLQSFIMYGFRLILNLTNLIVVAPLGFVAGTFESSGMNESFRSFYNYMHSIYVHLQDFGVLLAVLLVVFYIALSLMGMKASVRGHQGVGSGLISSVIGFFNKLFIILLYPLLLLGSLSGSVSFIKDAFNNLESSSPASYAVYSNIFDFGGAVEGSRLALPDDVNGKIPSSIKSGDVPIITHKQILALNAFSAGRKNAQDIYNGLYVTNKESPTFSNQIFSKTDEDIVNGGDFTSSSTPAVSKLITQWSTGATYRSSNWDSYVSSKYSKKDISENIKGDGDKGGSFAKNGTLTVSDGYFKTSAAIKNGTTTRLDPKDKGGLSTAGMYNYLSSVFDATTISWIDNSKLDTNSSASSHYSAGLVGRNIVGMSNYAIMLAVIIAVDILGLICVGGTFSSLWTLVTKGIAQIFPLALGSSKGFIASLIWALQVIANLAIGPLAFVLGSQLLQVFVSVSTDAFNTGTASSASEALFGVIMPHTNQLQNITTAGALSSGLYSAVNFGMAVIIIFVSFKIGALRNHLFKAVQNAGEAFIERIRKAVMLSDVNPARVNTTSNNFSANNPNSTNVNNPDDKDNNGPLPQSDIGDSTQNSSNTANAGQNGADGANGEIIEGQFSEVDGSEGGSAQSDASPAGDFNGDMKSVPENRAQSQDKTIQNNGADTQNNHSVQNLQNRQAENNATTAVDRSNTAVQSDTEVESQTSSIDNFSEMSRDIEGAQALNNENMTKAVNAQNSEAKSQVDADNQVQQSSQQNVDAKSNPQEKVKSANVTNSNAQNNSNATNVSRRANTSNSLTNVKPYTSVDSARKELKSARANLMASNSNKTAKPELNAAMQKIARNNMKQVMVKAVKTVDAQPVSKAFATINAKGDLLNKNLTNGQVREKLNSIDAAYKVLDKANASGSQRSISQAKSNLKSAVADAKALGVNRATFTSHQAVKDSIKSLQSEYDSILGVNNKK